jgi:elongation factor P
MATTADIKNGLCIKHNDKLFQVIEFQHVKPGKGPAFVRTKIRQIESGKVLDHTFSAGHKIETVRIENREYQYLYQEGSDFVFMNNETFEQVNIPAKMIEKPLFLMEGMVCNILFHAEEETPLVVENLSVVPEGGLTKPTVINKLVVALNPEIEKPLAF